MKKSFESLRPAPHVVFAAKIWNGCTMYSVTNLERNGADFFGTKREANEWIKDHFTGDEKRIRMFDLKNAGR